MVYHICKQNDCTLGKILAGIEKMIAHDHIDCIDQPVDVGFDCPLDLHCTYTRDQLPVALAVLLSAHHDTSTPPYP